MYYVKARYDNNLVVVEPSKDTPNKYEYILITPTKSIKLYEICTDQIHEILSIYNKIFVKECSYYLADQIEIIKKGQYKIYHELDYWGFDIFNSNDLRKIEGYTNNYFDLSLLFNKLLKYNSVEDVWAFIEDFSLRLVKYDPRNNSFIITWKKIGILNQNATKLREEIVPKEERINLRYNPTDEHTNRPKQRQREISLQDLTDQELIDLILDS